MKRLLPLLLALVLVISAIVPAYATGDGNFDGGGGGMGNGSKTNYWNPGMDGVRVSIVDVGSHSVVRTPIDLTNKVPAANVAHFGKVSKLSYNAGRGLSVSVSGYSYRNPSQSLPKIISTGSSKASIAAIRSYFTDEQVIRSIAGYAGMDFDTLIGGDYKLVVEPLAYLCYNGQQFAMTATEAALYDQIVNGDLRKKLGTLTHKNLPLAIFLEEADLGYAAWSGSRTDKASNGDIISSLGIGIVRFNEVTTPPEPGEYDYEYRVNTEVITSVEVRGGQSDPDNPVSVRFNIQGRTYTVSKVWRYRVWSLLYRGSLQCSAPHNSFGGIAGFRIASSLGLVNRFSYLLSVCFACKIKIRRHTNGGQKEPLCDDPCRASRKNHDRKRRMGTKYTGGICGAYLRRTL